MTLRAGVLAVLVTGLAVATGGCRGSTGGAPGAGPRGGPGAGGRAALAFPVEVTTVTAEDVEYSVAAVGAVEAFEVIQVTARVAGAVDAVHFAEGDEVQADAVLVEIEPRRYRLAVDSARATRQRIQAALDDARKGMRRRDKMAKGDVASAEEVGTYRTRVATLEAEQAGAQAALSLAELNLRDAHVRVGIQGIIQTRTVATGQYLQPGAVLATIVRKDPLLLRFLVPAADAARVHPGMQARFRIATVPGSHRATLVHVAAAVEESTRMLPVVARVEPPLDGLRPGLFAEIAVPVGAPEPHPVVPQTAIRPSEKGFLGYVIAAGKANERVLTLGMSTLDGRVEVKTGLQPGEQLVVRGADALKQGVAVRIVPDTGPGQTGKKGPAVSSARRGDRGPQPHGAASP